MKILIIGYGIIGKWVHLIFNDADIWDIEFKDEKEFAKIKETHYDVAFICVPTEPCEDGSCDTSIVEKVITDYMDHVDTFCIRSTIEPGTTERIAKTIYQNVVFSPEYAGGTQHANAYSYEFAILGGKKDQTQKVANAYKAYKDGRFKICEVDSYTAELVKYAENSWIANKVTFCNEFARICKIFDVDYNLFREMLLLDPRINPSHTFVYEDAPYYDSHCLNKDVPAIIHSSKKAGYDPEFLNAMEKYNQKYKK